MGGAISALTSIVGGLLTRSTDRKAERNEKRARALEQQEQNVRNRREQIRNLAEARVLRAQIRGSAAAGGVSGSGPSGGAGSVTSQSAANVGFINQLMDIQRRRGNAINTAIVLRRRAAEIRFYNQALGNVAGGLVDFFSPGGGGGGGAPAGDPRGGPSPTSTGIGGNAFSFQRGGFTSTGFRNYNIGATNNPFGRSLGAGSLYPQLRR